jgi:hypothetical protein
MAICDWLSCLCDLPAPLPLVPPLWKCMLATLSANSMTKFEGGDEQVLSLHASHDINSGVRELMYGLSAQVPDKDEYNVTKQQIMADIDVSMGGKVAEEIIFGPDQVNPLHPIADRT